MHGLVACLAMLSMLAGSWQPNGTRRYRGWDQLPIAYFLTGEEREEWRNVESDTEATAFTDRYFSRRGPAFRNMVEARIAAADRAFGAHGRPGSQTLRGKVVILLGAPAAFQRTNGSEIGRPDDMRIMDMYTNVGPLGAGSVSFAIRPTVYSFVYGAAVIHIEVDERTGAESIPERERRVVEAVFRAAAENSRVAP